MNNHDAILTVYASPLPIPFSLAVHTWIEVEENNKVTRWEVWQHANLTSQAKGHVYTNLFESGRGIRVFYLGNKKFRPTIIVSVEQPPGLTAKLKKMVESYPVSDTYRYVPGPNSNTFTAWIIKKLNLNNTIKLPWRAFGKNYVKILPI